MVAATPLPIADTVRDLVSVPTTPASNCATPDPSPVLAIHRGSDGFVNFRAEGHRDDVFSIPAGSLMEMFPAIREHLTKDAYFSINGFWKRGLRISRFDPERQVVSRRQDNLRYLNACFTDLD